MRSILVLALVACHPSEAPPDDGDSASGDTDTGTDTDTDVDPDPDTDGCPPIEESPLYTLTADAGRVFVALDASSQACAVQDDGQLRCLFSTEYLPPPPSGTFSAVSCGFGGFCCALDVDRSVACWGTDDQGRGHTSPPAGEFVSISTGFYLGCALTDEGRAVCWGWDELGIEDEPPGTFVQVESGCGLDTTGHIDCWGSDDSWVEEQLVRDGLDQRTWTALQSGVLFCAQDADGWTCWDGYQTFVFPAALGSLSVGDQATCVLDPDGYATCRLYEGSLALPNQAPHQPFEQISAGGGISCGLEPGGARVTCWPNTWGWECE